MHLNILLHSPLPKGLLKLVEGEHIFEYSSRFAPMDVIITDQTHTQEVVDRILEEDADSAVLVFYSGFGPRYRRQTLDALSRLPHERHAYVTDVIPEKIGGQAYSLAAKSI